MRHLPKTRTAAGLVVQRTRNAYALEAATALLDAADRVEEAAGDPDALTALTADVLRLLGEMVGPTWLGHHVDDPDVAAVAHLVEALGRGEPAPPVADLDELVSRVIWTRFPPA